MEGFESWSKQWWFPEQTWSFHAAVSVNLTFGRRDLELISSIISDLDIVRPSPSQREDTLAKMKTHFSSSTSRRSSVVTERAIQSYDDNFEDWEGLHQALSTSEDRFEVRGFQAQLNAVADHYLASMPKGQKAIVPARFRLKPNIYRHVTISILCRKLYDDCKYSGVWCSGALMEAGAWWMACPNHTRSPVRPASSEKVPGSRKTCSGHRSTPGNRMRRTAPTFTTVQEEG